MNVGLAAAFEYFGRYAVDAVSDEQASDCEILVLTETRDRPVEVSSGWTLVAREARPTDNDTIVAVYRRTRLGQR